MNLMVVWKKIEEKLQRLRSTAPPDWEQIRQRGMVMFIGVRAMVGAFIVGAYFAAQVAIEKKGAAAPAFFTTDYLTDWTKGLILGLIGGCAVGFIDWQLCEGAYRSSRQPDLDHTPNENHEHHTAN
ncbi:MAG TPA: hypothetical protein VEF04_19320 [Blastocatellia bacterium]|nr:hypothetical protein [Blastocatellia bacterium]